MGALTGPQATLSAVTASFTTNLSLGERPVRLVNPSSEPLAASFASLRRIECSTRSAGERLKWVRPSPSNSAISLTCIVVAMKSPKNAKKRKRRIVPQRSKSAKCEDHNLGLFAFETPNPHSDAVPVKREGQFMLRDKTRAMLLTLVKR